MHWPRTPTERIPPARFRPPFCPRVSCPCHIDRGRPFRWIKRGSYSRRCDRRSIPKFECKACGRIFSQQSFAATYYLKRPRLLPSIAAGIVAGSAARQIARSLGCSHTTVLRQGNRLGRHALLLMSRTLRDLPEIREPVTLDHFETFQFCQEMPLGIATPVGATSWFVYDLDPVPHRRGGKMTPRRKERLEERIRRWGSIPVGSYRESASSVLRGILPKVPESARLELITDDHPAYRTAVRRENRGCRIVHRVHANPIRGEKGSPRTPKAVARDLAMFPVDLLHRLWRHTSANHKRETIAFGRRGNAILLRGFLFLAWRNFVKDLSERRPTQRTPAMVVGATSERWTWQRMLSRRLFSHRIPVSARWMTLYRQEMVTPAVGRNEIHGLIHAF